jgi:5-enolpyruvylshikimate-3-phosphate synthase
MAFAILGLARGGVSIANPGCVGKSWPGFWTSLDLLRSGT